MAVAGLLLAGGGHRLPPDKPMPLPFHPGMRAARMGRILAEVCSPAVEVGPGISALPSVRKSKPAGGPLAAIATGASLLKGWHFSGGAVVLSTGATSATGDLVAYLASQPDEHNVVPLIGGSYLPFFAKLTDDALVIATEMVAEGETCMERFLHSIPVKWMENVPAASAEGS